MSIERMKKVGKVASVADPALQALLDKQACAEVMMTYCRAIDHRDEELLRCVFHPGSKHHHGFKGPSSDLKRKSKPGKPGDFVAFALEVLGESTRTHHQLGNLFVEIEPTGSEAYTEAYFTAYHRLRANSDAKAGANAHDTEMDYWVGGRYMDRMEKRDEVWKIVSRIGTTDWQRLEAPASKGQSGLAPQQTMQPSRRDPLFQRPRLLK